MAADPTSRIVVALDAGDDRDLALELACHVALAAAPELLGLFIENVRLLEHAQSKLAREVMLTGRERPFERAALERQLRAQATRARARFEAAAARLGLRHSFHVARGEIVAELVRGAAEAEALVVSLAAQARGASQWPGATLRALVAASLPLVLFAREGWRSGRSVAVLVEDAGTAQPALAAAARLARHSRSPITALLRPGAGGDAERDRAEIRGVLARGGIDGSDVIALAEPGPAGIVQAARACRARLVVLPCPMPATQADLVEELLRKLPSALLLVRR